MKTDEVEVMIKKNINIIIIFISPIIFYLGVKWIVANNPYSICLFKLITGHECWGCGITRAFNALFELQFKNAFEFNPRIIIVAPLMGWVWLQTLIKAITSQKTLHSVETSGIEK